MPQFLSDFLVDPVRLLGTAGLVVFALLVALGTRSPIFRIDVLTTPRRFRYFLVRILYSLVLFFVLYMCYGSTLDHAKDLNLQNSARFAQAFFHGFAWVQLLAVLALSPAVIAGTIATERERRTIEYLFATDLSNFELIVGKLLARLAQLAMLLILALPILQLARLFGGIRNDDLLAAFVVSLSTLVAVAGLSLARSVWSRRGRDAVISTYVILLALLIGPPIISGVLAGTGVGGFPFDTVEQFNTYLLSANPIWVLGEEIVTFGTRNWDAVWKMVSIHTGFAAVCLLASVYAVRRVHLNAAGEVAKRSWIQVRFRLPRPGPGSAPMLWKELFTEPLISRIGVLTALAFTVIVLLVGGLMIWALIESYDTSSYPWGGRNWALQQFRGTTTAMTTLVALGLLLIIAAKAAASVTSEKEKDSWLSLLATSLTGSEIVAGKILGSIYQTRWLGLLLVFIWSLALFRDVDSFIVTVPWQCITFLCVAAFVSALGVHFSLYCQNSVRSMAATLGIAIYIGGGYLLCCCIPMMVTGGGGDESMQLALAPCIPFLLAVPMMWDPTESVASYEAMMFVAYGIGTAGYALAALALYGSCVANFESLCERTHRTLGQYSQQQQPGAPPPPEPGTLPPLIETAPPPPAEQDAP